VDERGSAAPVVNAQGRPIDFVSKVAHANADTVFAGMHHLSLIDESGPVVGMASALDVLDWMARRAGYTPPGRRQA